MKKLDQQIQELYLKTPSEKKITYLEAMKHEFKKDPKLQSTTRNIAYEIIAEKVATRSEIVNELKHFNPDDEVILKDISRYKTWKEQDIRELIMSLTISFIFLSEDFNKNITAQNDLFGFESCRSELWGNRN
ncbi:hypothetical protein OVA29_21545 [Exiguobacterium sp. SL14]|nr:hypothetical protein [Exiguobacterium sp. SL14]